MVAAQIGENGAGKIHPFRPALVERVGTHLDRGGAAAVFPHLGEQLLKIEGLGRGVTCGTATVAGVVRHRAEKSAAQPAGRKEGLQQHGGGGFAVGSGDADDLQMAGGMTVKVGGHATEGAPAAFHADIGDGQIGETFLHHHGNRAALERIGDKGVTIALVSFPRAKDRAGRDAAGIVGERRDFGLLGAFPGADLHPVHDFGQLHNFSRLATTAPRSRLSCSATWVAISRNAGAATWPP